MHKNKTEPAAHLSTEDVIDTESANATADANASEGTPASDPAAASTFAIPSEEELPEELTLGREQLLALKASIEALQAERDRFADSALRSQADFDNYRKRNANLRQESYDDGVRDAVATLIPVLDNLDRAAEAAGDSPSPLLDGVRLVAKQFADALVKLNVVEIEAAGCSFDPAKHHAVAQGDCDDGQEAGVVQEVFLKGYAHKDRVLRASMVKVSQA